jgi:hypothetical protein
MLVRHRRWHVGRIPVASDSSDVGILGMVTSPVVVQLPAWSGAPEHVEEAIA